VEPLADIHIFCRVEKKYLLNAALCAEFLEEIASYIRPDEYGKSTVCSLYLDTPDRVLIRNSIDAKGIEKVSYKEKLRIRSYGNAAAEIKVFLEIKKKYKGVVYKRRLSTTWEKALRYLETREKPRESQIMEEIDYAMSYYGQVAPAMYVACEREAFVLKEDPNLRITFDTMVRARDTRLSLAEGCDGDLLLPEDAVLMEIKTAGAMPLWLAHVLDKYRIFPTSFSKYGTAHLRSLTPENCNKEPLWV
jgi:hypothetical protein